MSQYIQAHEDQVVKFLTIMMIIGFVTLELLLIGFHCFTLAFILTLVPIFIVFGTNAYNGAKDKDLGQVALSGLATGLFAGVSYIIIVLLLPFYV